MSDKCLCVKSGYNSHISLDVRKSMRHHMIQINHPTRCNSFTSLLLDVYVWLNVFRASPRPSSGACDCTRSLWFYRWRVAVGALLVVAWEINHPARCNSFTSLLLDVYVWLNMFRASPRPSSGAYNCTRNLGLPLERSGCSVVGRGLPDHDQQRCSRLSPTVKSEASSAVLCS